ncbi:hypothetical protein, partial [Salmonella enterica]|uniref:hypothetical protein n=1 Tax=Salmonella enterica TaxID=28901 RepID=UPI0038B728F7
LYFALPLNINIIIIAMVTFTVGHLSLTLHLSICFLIQQHLAAAFFICDKELPPKLGKIAETYTDNLSSRISR